MAHFVLSIFESRTVPRHELRQINKRERLSALTVSSLPEALIAIGEPYCKLHYGLPTGNR
jgi:hypothetical protein